MVLQDIGSSKDIAHVLEDFQNCSPTVWAAFETAVHKSVIGLGMDRVGRQKKLFSAKAWSNVAKIVVILDARK